MKKIKEVINLVIDKYLDIVNILLCKDMLTLEYLYYVNEEPDIYKTIQITEIDDKLSLKIYPDKTTKIITVNDLEDIFDILSKQICKKEHTSEEVKIIKNLYKRGTKIELIKMYDLYAPLHNAIGTVKGVDDKGQIQVDWDNGSSLSLVYGLDKFRVLSIPRTYEEIQHIKAKYKVGTKVRLIKLSNRNNLKRGTLANVESVDDLGTIHVRYKVCGTEVLIEGLDEFEVWEDPQQNELL